MNKYQYYEQAIDILSQDNDWKAICVSIAKSNPKVLVEASINNPIDNQAKALMLADKKIAAIKFIRQEKGLTLVDAKNYVEGLIS